MKVELTKEEFKDPFNRLLAGLVEGNDVTNFSVDKDVKRIQILLGDWTLELLPDGKWEID